jgi:hypothetical protein
LTRRNGYRLRLMVLLRTPQIPDPQRCMILVPAFAIRQRPLGFVSAVGTLPLSDESLGVKDDTCAHYGQLV